MLICYSFLVLKYYLEVIFPYDGLWVAAIWHCCFGSFDGFTNWWSWIWSNLIVNSWNMFRGRIFYASNSALLALWFLEHSLMRNDVHEKYRSLVMLLKTHLLLKFHLVKLIMLWYCHYVFYDAWIACCEVTDDAYILLELHWKISIILGSHLSFWWIERHVVFWYKINWYASGTWGLRFLLCLKRECWS